MPFKQYFLDIKIDKAREMLMLKKKTVTEVCFTCGFHNLSHLTAYLKGRWEFHLPITVKLINWNSGKKLVFPLLVKSQSKAVLAKC